MGKQTSDPKGSSQSSRPDTDRKETPKPPLKPEVPPKKKIHPGKHEANGWRW